MSEYTLYVYRRNSDLFLTVVGSKDKVEHYVRGLKCITDKTCFFTEHYKKDELGGLKKIKDHKTLNL